MLSFYFALIHDIQDLISLCLTLFLSLGTVRSIGYILRPPPQFRVGGRLPF